MARPYGVCDRCGFKKYLDQLRREWTGLRVCGPCHDPRPADTRPPRVKPEGVPLPNARPEPPPIYRDPNDLGGDDL